MRMRGLVVLGAVSSTLLIASAADAATVTVTTTGDPGPVGTTSLRQAIASAGAGDTVVVPSGHYTLKLGQITVAQAIKIRGAGASTTMVDGNNASRIFDVTASGTTTIQNLTLTRGHLAITGSGTGGGAVLSEGGNLTLSSDAFTNDAVTGGSAGDYQDGGGAVYNAAGAVTITGSNFQGDMVTLAASTGGVAHGGGAIYDNAGGVTMSGTTLTGNAVTLGGAHADNGGGAYFEDGGGLTATDSSFTNNVLTLNGGTTVNGGGAVYDNGGGLHFSRVSVTGNTAALTGVTSSNGGGGVMDNGGGPTWVNVTLGDNTLSGVTGSANGGGGLRTESAAHLTNATISGNRSSQGGGGIVNDAATFLKSSIIAGNSASSGAANCVNAGALTSLGHNLEDHSPTTCGLTGTGDIVGQSPRLAPLANNGGPGPTNALLSGSPAVDHIPVAQCTDQQGSPQPVTTDERGVPRGLDGFCDIGAYETAPPDLKLGASASPAKVVAGQKSSVTFTISDAGPAPATNTKLTLSVPKGLKLVSVTPSQIGTVTTAGTHVTVVVQGTKKGKQSLTGTVTASESDPTPADNTASASVAVRPLKLSKLKVKHKRISFRLNAAATVKFTLERCSGRHCKKLKSFKVNGRAGKNHKRLRHLKAGRYKLLAIPVLAGVKGPKASVSFRIP